MSGSKEMFTLNVDFDPDETGIYSMDMPALQMRVGNIQSTLRRMSLDDDFGKPSIFLYK